jgi:hypothetical protein
MRRWIDALKLWTVALGRFVRRVGRLIWRPVGGISTVLGVGGVFLVAWLLGQRWGLVVLVAGLALLFLIAGVGLEREALDAEQVRLRFEPLVDHDENSALLSVRVHNEGPDSEFSATLLAEKDVASPAELVDISPFEVRWFGLADPSCHIAHDAYRRLNLAEYESRGRTVSVLRPGDGPAWPSPVLDQEMRFILELRDTRRDRPIQRVLVISLAKDADFPTVEIAEASGEPTTGNS